MSEWRYCEFCNCHTNAHRRACCNKGREADSMREHLEKLSCGSCGNFERFQIYQDTKSKEIIVECLKCSSETLLTVKPQPEVSIEWGEKSDGILCHLE